MHVDCKAHANLTIVGKEVTYLLAKKTARKPLPREVIRGLQNIVGASMVLHRPEDLLLYEYDGSVEKGRPGAVVFPTTTQEVSQVLRLAAQHDIPVIGRGAGTGLSGGALARSGGIMIVFARMNRILELDLENQRAVVQPGVVNYELTRAVEH